MTFALLLVSSATAGDTDDEWLVQQFYSTHKRAYSVGETVRFTVRLLVTPPSSYSLDSAILAIKSGNLSGNITDWSVVRHQQTQVLLQEVLDKRVLDFKAQFFLKANKEGYVDLPSFRFSTGGREVIEETTVPRVYLYRPPSELYRSQSAVIPVEAVVREFHGGRRSEIRRLGTATLVGPDAILTSLHTVVDASKIFVELPSGKRVRVKRVWAVDPDADLAVLHINQRWIEAEAMVPLVVDSAHDPLQQAVFTIGWPGFERTLTAGVLSGEVRLGQSQVLVSDNPIRPGDSGGPLISSSGNVIGIVTAGTLPSSFDDVLSEEVCISTNPRRVMAIYRAQEQSIILRRAFRSELFATSTRVQAMRLLSTLRTGVGWQNFQRDLQSFSAAALRERDPEVLFVHGNIYRAIGNEKKAEVSYKRALELDREHFLASYLLGVQQLLKNSNSDALQYFEQTARTGGYLNLSEFGKARALLAQGKYPDARTHFRKVLSFDSTFQPALHDLAICHLALGDRETAIQFLAALRGMGVEWANRLELVIENEVLQPVVLNPIRRAQINTLN